MEKIKCRSCGAEFEEALIRCPFCGTGYAPAEENEYMDKLEGIRKDLESHKDDAEKSLKKSLKPAVLAVVIAVVLIVALIIGGLWLSGAAQRSKSDQRREEFLKNQGITLQQEDQ